MIIFISSRKDAHVAQVRGRLNQMNALEDKHKQLFTMLGNLTKDSSE